MIATDLDGRVTDWNRLAEALCGWSVSEALGRLVVDLTTPEMSREQADAILAALARGERWSGEFLVRRRDGTAFWAQVQAKGVVSKGDEAPPSETDRGPPSWCQDMRRSCRT